MIYGLVPPGSLVCDAYLTQASTAKEALKQFEKFFPGIFTQSAFFLVKFNDVGTVTRDMRILKYIPKKRLPRVDLTTANESYEVKEYLKNH